MDLTVTRTDGKGNIAKSRTFSGWAYSDPDGCLGYTWAASNKDGGSDEINLSEDRLDKISKAVALLKNEIGYDLPEPLDFADADFEPFPIEITEYEFADEDAVPISRCRCRRPCPCRDCH